ncbi:uncharacterized protein LOC118752359 [Rhagoletis pomonella]|uniref:uncharacterized protein LOC118752359 n=1 Tax=Rhagoletis pomonella TaxID=28610 RepID=UPI0017816795|nr:uncharacterized protein LOC118752359 [Rhagoletis pomonella]
MFRAVVDYKANATPKCQSLIIKTLPELEGQKKDLLSQSFIFETEIGMYTEVLPRFEENLRKAGDKTTLKPPWLYYSLSPHKVLVLDDIVPKGFELIRDRAMTMEEAKAAYERLAKWHAVSFKIIKQELHFFDRYQHGLFTMPNLLNEGLMTDGIKFFIEMLKKKATLHQFVPHFEALRPVILQRCLDTFREFRETPRADAYYVLCHGDFTIKNMMFKHNSADGSLVDVQLLDFQLSYVGSIASDLIYSMVQLLDEHLRKQFPILVEYYFNIFIETLLKLKYKGALPKLEKLREHPYLF